jgi:CheY-like chemotaxis protein
MKKRYIFLADDSLIVRETLPINFAKAGFVNVKTFHNGRELMPYLESSVGQDGKVCDIVITDIEMPLIDGLYLTRKIKKNSNFKHCPQYFCPQYLSFNISLSLPIFCKVFPVPSISFTTLVNNKLLSFGNFSN